MYDVMEGVRVAEMAEHTFAPAAVAMLADWGADIIKVERITNEASIFLAARPEWVSRGLNGPSPTGRRR